MQFVTWRDETKGHVMKLYSLDNKFIKEASKVPDDFTGIAEYHNGTKSWFVDGKHHRIDGPAIENSDGSKYWCVDGKQVTELQCNLLCDMMKLKGLLK